MYRCSNCGCEFETPSHYPDFSGEAWGVPFTRYYDGCPRCKSDDYSDAEDFEDE